MDAAKIAQMNAIKAALEDLHNSQEAVLQKVGQIEVNLMNNPDEEVEDDLTEVYANASDNAALVKEVLDKFNMRVEKANKEFKPAPEEGETEA